MIRFVFLMLLSMSASANMQIVQHWPSSEDLNENTGTICNGLDLTTLASANLGSRYQFAGGSAWQDTAGTTEADTTDDPVQRLLDIGPWGIDVQTGVAGNFIRFNALNGRPIGYSANGIEMNPTTGAGIALNDGMTMFAVARMPTAVNTINTVFQIKNDVNDEIIRHRIRLNGNNQVQSDLFSNLTSTNTSVDPNRWYVIAVRFDFGIDPNYDMHLDGVFNGEITTTGPAIPQVYDDPGMFRGNDIEVADVIVMDNYISDVERAQVEACLAGAYGL